MPDWWIAVKRLQLLLERCVIMQWQWWRLLVIWAAEGEDSCLMSLVTRHLTPSVHIIVLLASYLPHITWSPHFTETGEHNTTTIRVLLGPDTHQPPAIINIAIKTQQQQYTCSYHTGDFPRSRHMLLTCSPPICWICTCYMLNVTFEMLHVTCNKCCKEVPVVLGK